MGEPTPNETHHHALRVVMVIQRFRPSFSGQGVQVEELARALVRRGVEVTVLAAMRRGEAAPEERSDGVTIRRLRCDLLGSRDSRLGRRLWSPTFALRTFLHLLRDRRGVDFVHVHGANDALYAAWLFGRLLRVPVLFELTLVGADDPETIRNSKNWFAAARYAVYRRFPGYVAISPALAETYRNAGLPGCRLRMIPQGVDLGKYRPADDRPSLRRDLGVSERDPLFVFLGSLVARKGIDVLLGAWERIHRGSPSAQLLLVGVDRFPGDREAERFLRECLTALSPSALTRVRRLGVRDDAERFLQIADVFLFPSRREGFGTAIIEAMASGVPCVVAALPGITDYIFAAAVERPSAARGAVPDGLVVPQEDPGALAEAALELLSGPERAAAIGAAGRARVREQFDIERIAEQYLSWYAALLRGSGSGARP
jgi:glycosyltransferase involved in cell wall biosynthesis